MVEQIQNSMPSQFQAQENYGQVASRPAKSPGYDASTLASQKKDSCFWDFASFLMTPVFYVGKMLASFFTFIREKLFCCIPPSTQQGERINWLETKTHFKEVFRLVCVVEVEENRQAKYEKELKALSPTALKQFKEHIGLTIAEKSLPPEKRNRVEQEAWWKENGKPEMVKSHIKDLNSAVLKDAVQSFYGVIQRNTRVSDS